MIHKKRKSHVERIFYPTHHDHWAAGRPGCELSQPCWDSLHSELYTITILQTTTAPDDKHETLRKRYVFTTFVGIHHTTMRSILHPWRRSEGLCTLYLFWYNEHQLPLWPLQQFRIHAGRDVIGLSNKRMQERRLVRFPQSIPNMQQPDSCRLP